MYEDGYQDSVTLDDLLEDARYAEAEEALASFCGGVPGRGVAHQGPCNPDASIYADCGTRNDEPRAGWGRVVADFAVACSD